MTIVFCPVDNLTGDEVRVALTREPSGIKVFIKKNKTRIFKCQDLYSFCLSRCRRRESETKWIEILVFL
jgi:hypothetical protein